MTIAHSARIDKGATGSRSSASMEYQQGFNWARNNNPLPAGCTRHQRSGYNKFNTEEGRFRTSLDFARSDQHMIKRKAVKKHVDQLLGDKVKSMSKHDYDKLFNYFMTTAH